MTIHLYYTDAYLTEFSAVVLEQRRLDDGYAVIMDRTAFYPTSGGQPHDTGTLGAARVVDVQEEPSGAILHFVDSQLPPGSVSGLIDWERRFDHMQQHTGQHILSQAFVQKAHAPTLSFHLGQESSTIDLQLSQPSAALIEEVEELATQMVFDDRPVHILTVDRDGLSALGVRKESQREGELRVIDVEGFDRSPCGGTHVRRTGEIGMISILGYERYKAGTRVDFVCGRRVLKTLRHDHDLLRQLGRFYSAPLGELPRLAEKTSQERSALARENSRLTDQVLEMEAQQLIHSTARVAGSVLVRKTFAGRSLESVKVLAQKVTRHPETVALLGLLQDNKAHVIVSKNSGVAGNCGAAVQQAAARLGGRGGGKPDLAQAGGIAPEALEPWLDELQLCFESKSLSE